jgi:hypothetical protein
VAKSEGVRSLEILAATAVVALAGCGGAKTTTVTVTSTVERTRTVTVQATTATTAEAAPCLASALDGTFGVVPGSAGAGQISYRLRLANQGDAACFLSGIPQLQLLDAAGARLPTNVSPARPGTGTAVRVDLQPGDAATADARFSPDVPGGSEQTDGPCEPKSVTLRVTVGSGTVDVPVQPPTPVCERGSLLMSNYVAAS